MKLNQFPIKMTSEKKTIFRMHKASILLIIAAVIIVASIFLSPVFSQSTSPCSSCHGGYNQYLDILEGNTANLFPHTIQVGGTATVKISGIAAWVFAFLGLVTGMIWAQIAWGSYWSWDPKETLTYALFVVLSLSEVAYFEKKPKISKSLILLPCVLTVITVLSSFIMTALHSFA